MAGVNGGTLRRGNPGNKGGRGAVPSRIRRALQGDFVTECRPLLRSTVRGDFVHRMRVPLADILEHALCPNCDSRMEMQDPDKGGDITLDVRTSAPIQERLKAVEAIAKYGLGTQTELTIVSPDVQERLRHTVALIASKPSWESSEELLQQMGAIWR